MTLPAGLGEDGPGQGLGMPGENQQRAVAQVAEQAWRVWGS